MEHKKEIERIKHHISCRIGFNYNKTWHSASFWSNISTPINLSLTLLTALLAADASSTGNLISHDQYMILSFSTMVLTTINSYFKPHIKSTDVNDTLTKWIDLGHTLETLEFTADIREQELYSKYKDLLKDTNNLIKLQASKDTNFLSDWFHRIARWYKGRDEEHWVIKQKKEDIIKKDEIVIEMNKRRIT